MTVRVERALRLSSYPQLRRLDVSFCEGLIVLRGTVPSYYLKQLAQATAMAVQGVRLRNDVRVVPAT